MSSPETTNPTAVSSTPEASQTPAPAESFTKDLTPEAIKTIQEFGWPFFKAGVLIVNEHLDQPTGAYAPLEPLYLLVKEAKVKEKQPDGTKKWVKSDKGKWNLPCGRLQPGESFEQAALREGREESGFEVQLDNLCHVGHRPDSDNPYVIFIYTATTKQFIENPDPEEIAGTREFTYAEVLDLLEQGQLRNPDLTMGAIEQYRKYETQSDGLVVTYPSKTK